MLFVCRKVLHFWLGCGIIDIILFIGGAYMNIVELNGGLGNQISQYIFARFLNKVLGKEHILFDTMYFEMRKEHNGFELDKIFPNAKLELLKDNVSEEAWAVLQKQIVSSNGVLKNANFFYDNGLNIALVADGFIWAPGGGFQLGYTFEGFLYKAHSGEFFKETDPIHKEVKNSEFQHLYYCGAWLWPQYCEYVKKEIEHELKFPEFEDESNISYRDDILSQKISVGIHVRRGDFVQLGKSNKVEEFAKTIKNLRLDLVKKENAVAAFYIFSDDIAWCKENIEGFKFRETEHVVFIEGNDVDERNYMDMQLMTYCDYLVRDKNSSFCLSAKNISEKNVKVITINLTNNQLFDW